MASRSLSSSWSWTLSWSSLLGTATLLLIGFLSPTALLYSNPPRFQFLSRELAQPSGWLGNAAAVRISGISGGAKIAATAAAVLLVSEESRAQRYSGFGKSRRQLLDDNKPEAVEIPTSKSPGGDGIRVELKHRDHELSPLRGTLNLTLGDRIRRDVARSRARASVLSSMMITTAAAAVSRNDDHEDLAAAVSSTGGGGATTVSTDTFESPLSATVAEYVMSLSLGTPPQKFNVVVDTGSDLVWVQGSPCVQCFQQNDAVFNPTQSSSYHYLTCSDAICNDLGGNLDSCSPNCQYTYSYGDQSSTRGDFSTETVTLSTTSGATQEISNFAFGCGHQNQGTFRSTDGLVGLGQGSVSFSSQLGSLFGDKFSYCLVSREQALTQTSPLLFGDAAIPMGASSLQYTPILPSSPGIGTFYYVGLQGLSIAGSLVSTIPSSAFAKDSSGNGGTIFDSGTTFTQLVSTAYDAVIAAFQAAVSYPQVSGSPQEGLDLCFNINGVQNVVVPELTFHFTNADFSLPAPNFFVLVDTAGTMCLAISRSPSSLNIFGNTQQQNFQILYDRENAQIGFTPVTCSSLQ